MLYGPLPCAGAFLRLCLKKEVPLAEPMARGFHRKRLGRGGDGRNVNANNVAQFKKFLRSVSPVAPLALHTALLQGAG